MTETKHAGINDDRPEASVHGHSLHWRHPEGRG